MARRHSFALIAALSIPLAGCGSVGSPSLVASTSHTELSPAAASAIAGDMVARLAEHVGRGTATIVIKSDGSPFGQALEAALRGWGYAVATDQRTEGNAIQLAYVIDSFEGAVLTRLSTPQLELGRAYSVTAGGATPTSPLSIMRRGEGRGS